MKKNMPAVSAAENLDESDIALSLPAVALLLKFAPEMQERIVARLIQSIVAQERKEAKIILTQHVTEAAIAVSQSGYRGGDHRTNGTALNGKGAKKKNRSA
ncbi:MAG: hypothetical protein G01um101425_11 [Candidatus Peregrinibacteria bacterium Gr01-1014_25]|nr:MAG: hypothetical protein G01um101425_11 [Candidatus Peregrinibacteria bacterium Gr01-1014_25]